MHFSCICWLSSLSRDAFYCFPSWVLLMITPNLTVKNMLTSHDLINRVPIPLSCIFKNCKPPTFVSLVFSAGRFFERSSCLQQIQFQQVPCRLCVQGIGNNVNHLFTCSIHVVSGYVLGVEVSLYCVWLQNRRPSVYLPTREYPSEQSRCLQQQQNIVVWS